MTISDFWRGNRRFLLVASVGVFGVLCFCCSPYRLELGSAEQLQAYVAHAGLFGPVLYVALYTLRPLLCVPSLFFNLAAGALFGPYWGVVLLLLGGMGNALLVYGAGRCSENSSSFLWRMSGKWGERSKQYLAQEGSFRRLLGLRLVPIFPYDPVSFAAGFCKTQLSVYCLATVCGMLPGAIAYNLCAVSMFKGVPVGYCVVALVLAFGLPLALWAGNEGRRGSRVKGCGDDEERGMRNKR